jgi:hypothetical protein
MAKDKKAIRRDILNKFRNIKEGVALEIPPLWLQFCYFEQLSGLEQLQFKNAVNDLISQGLIEDVGESFPHLKLTDKGVDLLFF